MDRSSILVPTGIMGWQSLYSHLRSQRRLWEARDLLHELSYHMPINRLIDALFPHLFHLIQGPPPQPLFPSLFAEWDPELQDESSSFAWLDISTTLSLVYMKSSDRTDDIKACLGIARGHAKTLLARSARNLKCRPYLRFLMAEVLFEGYSDPKRWKDTIIFHGVKHGDLTRFDGIFPDPTWPEYEPEDEESPEWRPTSEIGNTPVTDTIRLVLRAAEELGDIRMQAGCLEQLVHHGAEEPRKIFTQLSKIFLAVGNTLEQRVLLLSRYLVVKTPSERVQLRQDILLSGPCMASARLERKRYKVLAALALSKQENKFYRDRSRHVSPEKNRFRLQSHHERLGDTNTDTSTWTSSSSNDSEQEDFVEESQAKDKSQSRKRPEYTDKRVMGLERDVTRAQRLPEEFALLGSSNEHNEESRREASDAFGRNDDVDQTTVRKYIDSNPYEDNASMQYYWGGHETRVHMHMCPKELERDSHLSDKNEGDESKTEKHATVDNYDEVSETKDADVLDAGEGDPGEFLQVKIWLLV